MQFSHKKIYLIRHGETEWTKSGKHTGLTDIALTERGEQEAVLIGKRLQGHSFISILTSPLQRALQTCAKAGFQKKSYQDSDLIEWNYGDYEGMTTEQIWKKDPHWNLFLNGAPHGETIVEIEARANRVWNKIHSLNGDVALFSHGHFLRVLAARWLQFSAREGRHFALFPASISLLGFERTTPVLNLWNDTSHLSKL